MRKVLLSAVSIASLGLALSAAQAADIVPEPAPVASFTGFHIGVGGGAGYNFYDADSTAALFLGDEDGNPSGPAIIGNSIAGDDLGAWYGFGTIEAGFDYQFDNSPFVIGILANYDFNGDTKADASSSTFTDAFLGGLSLDNQIEAELKDSWFLGGRLGFVFNDDTLIYGLGGYTWVKGKLNADHEINSDQVGELIGFHASEDDNVDGWTIGAGLEHLITENLSLKVEYRHDFLGDLDFSQTTNVGDLDDDGNDDFVVHDGQVDFSRDTVRAVLSWRFNPFQ